MSIEQMGDQPNRDAPWWLYAAAVLMVAESALLVLSDVPIGFVLLQLTVVALLAFFLLSGSKIAWVLTLLDAIWQFGEALGDSWNWWRVGAAVALVGFLCAPVSVRFVWMERPWRLMLRRPSAVSSLYGHFAGLSLRGVVRIVRWESDIQEDRSGSAQRKYGLLLWRLGITLVLLLLLLGAIGMWKEETGSGVLGVLEDVVWTLEVVAFLVFLAALAFAGYSRLSHRDH